MPSYVPECAVLNSVKMLINPYRGSWAWLYKARWSLSSSPRKRVSVSLFSQKLAPSDENEEVAVLGKAHTSSEQGPS